MDMALTLISIASFFGLVLAWIALPATTSTEREAAPSTVSSPQTAH
jgi:hypothetical protein